MPWDNFQYNKQHFSRKPGAYRCIILAADKTTSNSSGLPMLRVQLRPSGTSANVNAYIVGNSYFDENFSRFLDAFPQLKEQKFTKDNCFSYRGAIGCVKLVLDDNGFFKVAKYPWINPEDAKELPAFKWYPREDDPEDPPEFLSEEFEELSGLDSSTLPF